MSLSSVNISRGHNCFFSTAMKIKVSPVCVLLCTLTIAEALPITPDNPGLSTWEPISPFEDQPSTTTESSALIPFVGTTVLVAEPATEIAPKEDPDPPARGDQPHENPEVEGGNEVDNSSYSTTEEPPESGIEGNVANSDMNNGPPTGLATTPTPMSKPEGGLSPHEERIRKLKFHLESKGCSDLAIQKILEKHGGANVHILRARTQPEEEDEHPNGGKGKRRGSGMRRGKGNNGGHHDDEDNEDDDVNNNDDKEGKRKRERKRKGKKGEHHDDDDHDDEHEDENEYEYEDGRKRKRERKGKGNKGGHNDHDDHDDEHEDENEDDDEGKRKRNRNGNGHGRNSTRTGRPKRSAVYKRSLPSEESEESMSECSYSLVSYSDSFSYSYSDSYSDSFSASKMHVFKRDVNESGPDGNESEPDGDSAGDDDASDQGGNSEGDDESGNGNENSDGHGGDESGQPADVDDSIAANDSEE